MRLYGIVGRLTLLLGLTACSTSASALNEDFDAHLFVVESFLGSSFDLRKVDGDGNGIWEEDQLGLLSVILEGGAVASGLNPSMVTQITSGFTQNLTKVEQELTVDIGSQGTVNLVSQLNSTDPVLGNAMQKLIAGFMTMADASTVTYVNQIADQVIVQVLDGTPEEDSIPSVQNQINFIASNFSVFGGAGSGSNFVGALGDVDGDTTNNLTEYTAASGNREAWLTTNNINPPLRLKNLSGGGLAISGIPMDFAIETAGGGGNVTYQWRKGTVSSSTLISSSSTFSIPFLNTSDNGSYFCVYSDGARTRNSPSLNLTVTRLNIFFSQNLTANGVITRTVGGSVTFTVKVQGGSPGPYQYTWKKGASPLPGAANSNTLTLTGIQTSDAGQYSVSVTSNGGGDTINSNSVTLNVNSNIPPISITQQPKSAARQEGASHTFSIGVSGGSGNYIYDWRKGGESLGVANQDTLVIAAVNQSTIGTYSCFVTDAADNSRTALSQNAELTITDNPVFITQQPLGDTVALGEQVVFTVVAGGGGGTYSYEWRKNGVAISAPSIPSYTINATTATDAGDYTCVVSDAAELSNSVESEVAALNVLPVFNLNIIDQPDSITKSLGQSHTFSLTVLGGTGFYTYTWLKNGEPIGAPSFNTLTLNNIQVSDAGNYTCEVRDTFETALSATSQVAVLSLDLATLVLTQQPVGATRALGQSYSMTVSATGGSGDYSYDWRRNGESIGVNTATITFNSLQASDTGTYTCFVDDNQVAGEVLSDPAILVVLDAAPLSISKQPSGAFKYSGDQHALRVTVAGGSGTYDYLWRKDGEPLCGGDPLCNSAELVFGALAPTDAGTYSCVITDTNFPDLSITTVNVPLGVEDHLAITRAPRGRVVLAGELVELEVVAEGGYAPVSYEWRKNGTPILDAPDAPVLEIAPALLEDSAEYSCLVTDGFADALETAGALIDVQLVELPTGSVEFGPINLVGANTVPPSGSASLGQASGTLTNLNTKGGSGFSLNLLLTQGIGVNRGPVLTLKAGMPGTNGVTLFTIPFTPSVNFVDQTLQLTDEEASMVLSGRAYLNIATTLFPNGEVRAPLFPLTKLVVFHSGDIDDSFSFDLTELLRVIQLYNVEAYHCDDSTEDGYAPGKRPDLETCQPHSADYNPADDEWVISLSEVLRVIQFFNSAGRAYYECDDSEDGFCAGAAPEGEG